MYKLIGKIYVNWYWVIYVIYCLWIPTAALMKGWGEELKFWRFVQLCIYLYMIYVSFYMSLSQFVPWTFNDLLCAQWHKSTRCTSRTVVMYEINTINCTMVPVMGVCRYGSPLGRRLSFIAAHGSLEIPPLRGNRCFRVPNNNNSQFKQWVRRKEMSRTGTEMHPFFLVVPF